MKLGSLKEAWVKSGTNEKIAHLAREDIRTIAIIKHAALGDLVHTRPMILELRKHFPNASITFSAASHYTRGIPHDLVDRVHIACGKDKKYTLKEQYQSARSLGKHDIIFDITQTSRAHWISLLNDAYVKVGFKHKGIERLVYDVAISRAEFRFEAETFLEQLHVFGYLFDWPPKYAYKDAPESLIDGKYILYFPTASVAYKIWPAEMFSDLIARSCDEHPDYKHIILTGLADWEKDISNNIIRLLPKDKSVEQYEGGNSTDTLIRHASCLVSNDTGIRNLAISHNVPTVGIFIPQLLPAYVPNFGIHEVAYDLEGVSPDFESVYMCLKKVINKIDA